MAKPFRGTINVDIRGSEPDWIRQVQVNVCGKPCVDLEHAAVAMMARE